MNHLFVALSLLACSVLSAVAFPQQAADPLSTFAKQAGDMASQGSKAGEQIVSSISQSIAAALGGFAQNPQSGAKAGTAGLQIGQNVLEGISAALRNNFSGIPGIREATGGIQIGQNVLQGISSALGSFSPSSDKIMNVASDALADGITASEDAARLAVGTVGNFSEFSGAAGGIQIGRNVLNGISAALQENFSGIPGIREATSGIKIGDDVLQGVSQALGNFSQGRITGAGAGVRIGESALESVMAQLNSFVRQVIPIPSLKSKRSVDNN